MKELRDIWDWLREAKRQNIKGPELKEMPKIKPQAGTDLEIRYTIFGVSFN